MHLQQKFLGSMAVTEVTCLFARVEHEDTCYYLLV